MSINFDAITVEDCIELSEKKGKKVIIHNGKVIEIVDE